MSAAPVDRQRCEQVAARVAELQVPAEAPNRAAHLAATTRAITPGVVARCEESMSADEVRCTLAARSSTALAACTGGAAAAAVDYGPPAAEVEAAVRAAARQPTPPPRPEDHPAPELPHDVMRPPQEAGSAAPSALPPSTNPTPPPAVR